MDRVAALQRRERIISVVRWVGAAFLALQVTLYEAPTAELADTVARIQPVGYAIAAALAAVSLAVELVLREVTDERRLATWGAVFLIADVTAVMAVVFLYSFDPLSGTWAVMTVLPLEGALRFRVRGAMGTWATVGVLYLLRELYAAESFGVTFDAASLVYRLGLLLVIALFAGFTARDLDVQLSFMQRLNAASQQLASRLDQGEILTMLCEQAYDCLGARLAIVYVFDGDCFQPVASHPPEHLRVLLAADQAQREDPGLVDRILSGPLWLEADATHPARLAVPLRWQSGPVRHVLVVRPRRGRPSPFERELAASLAESAALALATTRVLHAEQRTSRRLRNLEALRTRFVATIAHDLRLPLTVFKGVSRMLRSRRDGISPERIDELLETVERQSNRLNRLADDLLDAARVATDHLLLHPRPCPLDAVVAATVADAEETVLVDVEDGLTVYGDPDRLERVVWNLLSNAEKYGKPPIEVRAWRDGDYAHLAVRDHGRGLDADQRERLFSDFAGSDDAASVGLGLAIVWQLVTAHGGTVDYDDAGPGARFVVALPVDGPPAPGEDSAGEEIEVTE